MMNVMRWHTRVPASQSPPTDDQCGQHVDDLSNDDGKPSAAAASISSESPSVSDDIASELAAVTSSCASMGLEQSSLDKKGGNKPRSAHALRMRSSSRDRQRAIATAANAVMIENDDEEDLDEEEDDDDGYDSYEYDPASGSDHALPDPPIPPADDELEGPPPSPSSGSPIASSLTPQQTMDLPWRPQNQQSTCEFTHTITNYSQKRESGCKKAEYSSTTVDAYGNRWRLIVYVNGNGRASNHHLSLFLQVADADDLPFGWKKAVSYVLTLEHPSGSSLGYAKRNPDKTFKLCPKAIDWGWSQFITSDRIQQEGYISSDSLTVRASVTVKSSSVSIDAADAELYLKCAVEEGNAESVKACLAQGASVNCQFKDDLYTPLHTACSSSTSSGSLEVLNLLLERGADGNACNKWRETPLLIAANNGHKAAVEALLDHGADPSLCSEAGWSALTFAAHKGYDQIVSLLLSAGAPVNCRVTEDLSTPLHKACAGGKPGHLSAVKQLLDGGADVHALNKWRETPLLTAANHGQAASVEALLRAGADPCKCTDTGWSPLSIAAYKGHDDVVRILLEEGAPTEEADPTLSALLQAATKGLPDTVELLLRHGADHTVTTKKGDTALSILVEQNLIDAAVEMVTEYKASVPRCSRDRKKVQRARLLINLRVKQQQREGLLGGDTSDDDSEQDEDDETECTALHDVEGENPDVTSSPKKKKKKDKSIDKAEAEARKAELALLQELEQEDQAMKEEAAASSKRAAKKKKKRDRERQQKLKEEKERREKEEKEAKEREREQRLKEEKLQKEREQKERSRRERELKEAAEREEQFARMRKEKEEQQKRQKEQEKKDRGKNNRVDRKAAETVPSSPGSKKEKLLKAKARKPTPEKVPGASGAAGAKNVAKAAVAPAVKPSPPVKKRGWEVKQDTPAAVSSPTRQIQPEQPHDKVQQYQRQQSPQRQPAQKANFALKRQSQQSQPVQAKQQLPQQQHQEQQRLLSSTSPPYLPKDMHQQPAARLNSPVQGEGLMGIPVHHAQHTPSVEEQLENMAAGVVDFLEVDSPNVGSSPVRTSPPMDNGGRMDGGGPTATTPSGHLSGSGTVHLSVELPVVAAYRYAKVVELLRRGSQLISSPSSPPVSQQSTMPSVNEDVFRAVLYRWINRAAHDSATCVDPIIPSWTEGDFLVTFLQRQFIAESRRFARGAALNFELLKETGARVADLCMSFAKDVAQFRARCESELPQDWSDATIGMTATELPSNGGDDGFVVIDWSGRSQSRVPSFAFLSLRNRYQGHPSRLLTAIFAVSKRYETRRVITAGTILETRLSPFAVSCMSRELAVSIELRSDPLSVTGNNVFCGAFPDVDVLFGGIEPFGKEGSNVETSPLERGGSAVVLPPLDNTTASLYLRNILDGFERVDNTWPLSVAVVLPSECFHDLKAPPAIGDLPSLDPRLTVHHGFVRRLEVLPSGQHAYNCGDVDGVAHVSESGSLLVILQNDNGSQRFALHDASVAAVVQAMTPGYMRNEPLPSNAPVGFPAFAGDPNAPPLSPVGGSDLGAVLGGFKSEPARGRRGRLFELVDDGGDSNDTDVVSDMLNLNVSMFQSGPAQDVNVEAISLMGINDSRAVNGNARGLDGFK